MNPRIPLKGYSIIHKESELRTCNNCGFTRVHECKGFYKYAHNGQCDHCGKFYSMNAYRQLQLKGKDELT